MNIHYKNYPTDYIDRLQGKGKRHKARCFWEYYNDMQNKQVNSIGFYARSWQQNGKGTASRWVKEFKDEIQRFYDAHILLNNEHYSSVKNKTGRQGDDSNIEESPTTPSVKTIQETKERRQRDEALNIYNNNKTARALYEGFYFLYRQFNRYAGNKLEAVDSFVNVDDVDHNRLSIASMFYLKDMSVEKKVGVKKFLDNKIYLNYMEMYLRVLVDSVWLEGVYDTDKEVFTSKGKAFKLEATKIADKLTRNEIEFMKEEAA